MNKTILLDKTLRHEWMNDGFCKWCRKHQTDWRPNDICAFLLRQKAPKKGA